MILRSLIRVVYGVDVFEEVATANRLAAKADRELAALRGELAASYAAQNSTEGRARRFWHERDDARDRAAALSAELDSVRKTNALLRSLVTILRETNQGLDERITHLEKLHGTPGPAAETASKPNER